MQTVSFSSLYYCQFFAKVDCLLAVVAVVANRTLLIRFSISFHCSLMREVLFRLSCSLIRTCLNLLSCCAIVFVYVFAYMCSCPFVLFAVEVIRACLVYFFFNKTLNSVMFLLLFRVGISRMAVVVVVCSFRWLTLFFVCWF